MVKVKPLSDIQTNYTNSVALVPARYAAGIKAATWQQQALAGQDVYVQRMSDPNVLKRRSSGISKVTDATWQNDAITKGQPVIGARMTAAASKQATNFSPYRDALDALTLPPRTADPMTNVTNRVGAVVQAMVQKKAQLTT